MSKMRLFFGVVFITVVSVLTASCGSSDNNGTQEPPPPNNESDVVAYVTSASQSMLFKSVPIPFSNKDNMSPYTVTLDPEHKFQQIDGFGAAFTGSTCYNLMKMPADKRNELLRETFDPVNGMGYSYIRISIGCFRFFAFGVHVLRYARHRKFCASRRRNQIHIPCP